MMYLPSPLVFAVVTVKELGRDYQEQAGPGIAWLQLLWFVIPVAMIVAVVTYYRKSELEASDLSEADGLLAELYQAHEFTAAARSLCNRIADTCDLIDPAVMMASPSVFDKAVERANQAKRFSAHQDETLGWVRRRLFG